MEEKLKDILAKDALAKYRLAYVDYEPGTWTLPAKLNTARIESFSNDPSLLKVEVRLSNGNMLIITA